MDELSLVDLSIGPGDASGDDSTSRIGSETRCAVGIGHNVVRLSVGLEDPDRLSEGLGRVSRNRPGSPRGASSIVWM